jgi:hypothetical protein
VRSRVDAKTVNHQSTGHAKAVPGPVALVRCAALILALALMLGAALPGAAGRVAAQGVTPGGSPVASPVADLTPAIEAAVASLLAQQAEDGGFVGFSGETDPGVTTDAALALAAADNVGVETGTAIPDALAYLKAAGPAYAETGPGQRAKLVLAVAAGGADPRAFAGADQFAPIETADPGGGVYGGGMFDHALVTLAASAVGSDLVGELATTLLANRIEDGSWGFEGTAPGSGDTNTTALAIQALAAAGRGDDPAVAEGIAYLRSAQARSGGFAYQPGDPLVPDANSTALAVQALIAAGEDPADAAANGALGALTAFQEESGGFRYNDETPGENLFATVQAIPALAGQPLPILPEGTIGASGTPAASPAAAVPDRAEA